MQQFNLLEVSVQTMPVKICVEWITFNELLEAFEGNSEKAARASTRERARPREGKLTKCK